MKAESPVLANYHVPEFTVGHSSPGFEPVPVVRLDEHTLVSRHSLSAEELATVNRTGCVYVLHASGRESLPIKLQADAPEFTLPVLSVRLAGTGRFVCHGLEVTEAGGSEAERREYAAAEAASLVAESAPLPCRVALLGADKPWLDFGGEECAERHKLEAALSLRIGRALSEGGRRVEARDAAGGEYRVDVAEMTPGQCARADAHAG